MERITADELRDLSEALDRDCDFTKERGTLDLEAISFLRRAAETIDEMDKDIAVYMTENEQLRRQIPYNVEDSMERTD